MGNLCQRCWGSQHMGRATGADGSQCSLELSWLSASADSALLFVSV